MCLLMATPEINKYFLSNFYPDLAVQHYLLGCIIYKYQQSVAVQLFCDKHIKQRLLLQWYTGVS